MRKAQVIMGTGVTIDIPAAKNSQIFASVFNYLKDIDRRFSTYKMDSEVSRYRRGELRWWQKSRDLRHVIRACQDAQTATDGAFSAWYGFPHSRLSAGQGNSQEPSGLFSLVGRQTKAMRRRHFDPSGYVKGWAIEEACKIIEKAGYSTYCISIGGDLYAAGDKIWRVGIQNPRNKMKSLADLNVKNKAVATSGDYVRGGHIINPKTGKPANQLASVTVVGPSIIDADVLATAAFVLGDFALNFIGGQARGYEALVVQKNGYTEMTKGFKKFLT